MPEVCKLHNFLKYLLIKRKTQFSNVFIITTYFLRLFNTIYNFIILVTAASLVKICKKAYIL